jgi:GTP-binding protein LepA
LAELVGEFYSAFKSVSSGFASLDYQLAGYEEADLVKMDILLAGEEIGALSRIVPKEQTQGIGRKIVDKLCEVIPRHNFEISVQAAIGGKILARGNIKPFRKDVTAKLYGGDQTRKDKLLKKQKKGKKRMKEFGRVSLPADTFWKILR